MAERPGARAAAVFAFIALGLAFEATWLAVGILSAWITDVPSFTASLAPDQRAPWVWLHGPVQARLGMDRSAITPPAPAAAAQLSFLYALGSASVIYVVALLILARCRTAGHFLTASIFGFAMLFVATTSWAPGLVSGDVILYATFGRVAGVHGLNPYELPAHWATLAQTDSTWWWYESTPYGPAWTGLSAILAIVTAQLSPLQQVLTFKLVAVLSFGATLALIWWLFPRLTSGSASRRDRTMAVASFAWNPLVLFETGQGHNDVFIAALLLAAVVPLLDQRHKSRGSAFTVMDVRWLLSFMLVTVNTLIKYLPVILGVFLTVLRLRELRGPNDRLRMAGVIAALACGVTALLVLPWRDSSAVLSTMISATGGGQRYANSIVDIPSFGLVARYLDKLSEHIQESLALVRFWEQVVVRIAMGAYVAWEIRRTWRLGHLPEARALEAALGGALRTSLLVVIFVLTQTLDYYFIPLLALAAALGCSYRWSRVALAISVLFLPTFYIRRMDLEPVPNLLLVVSLLGPLLFGWVTSARAALRCHRLDG